MRTSISREAGRKRRTPDLEETLKKKHDHAIIARETAGAAAGGVVGAVLGMAAGPPGAAVGAVLGAAAGAVAEKAIENEEAARSQRDEELDEAIGVAGGDLGAPNLEHPEARVGAYSAESCGVARPSRPPPAEGPMQPPEED